MSSQGKGFQFVEFSKRQKQFLYFYHDQSPVKDCDIIIADGSIRSGKTIVSICTFLLWSQEKHSHKKFIIAGKSIGALKRNVVEPMKQILTAWGWGYKHNRSENFIQIGTNTYHLFGANTEASQDLLQGLTAAGAYGDEVALFPKSFVDQMIGRCSVAGAKIFFNCNPNSPYHYFKQEFIDKKEEKNIFYLHFTMNDNLSLDEKVIQRYHRMFSGVFYQRYILGLWVMAEGIIFDMFDEKKHIVPTISREYDKYYVSIDYGTQNPFAMGLWGRYGQKWYKIKEYHYSGRESGEQKTDKEYADDYEEFIGTIPVKSVIVDPSATSFITELRNRGHDVTKAKNNIDDGLRRMANMLNNEKIAYNDCCKETFKEFKSYVWDAKAAEKGEDKPLQENDHHMDSDRYFINTILYTEQPKVQFFSGII